ncbi:uncharacterized protein LOC100179998 [Ciona intestinalis]
MKSENTKCTEATLLLTPLPAARFNDMKEVRRADSPLPAVPLPPKVLTRSKAPNAKSHNNNNQHAKLSASCDDLRQQPPAKPSRKKLGNFKMKKTASMEFDTISWATSTAEPPLTDGRGPIDHGSVHYAATKFPSNLAIHDYEELMENIHVDNKSDCAGSTTISNAYPCPQINSISQQSPKSVVSSVQDPRTNTRERQNPMYTGIRAASPIQNTLDSSSFSKIRSARTVIGPKCACALIAGMITAVLISLLSLILVFLFFIGLLRPLNFPNAIDQERFIDLENEVKLLKQTMQAKDALLNNSLLKQNATIIDLRADLAKTTRSQLEIETQEIRRQLTEVMTSLNTSEVENIFGSLSGQAMARCRHESFSIGSSSVQDVTDSGEYYADENFIITGATCSSSSGFVGSMETRRTAEGGEERTYFKCKCVRINGSSAPSSGRVECRIDYWQCPLSLV